MRCVLPRSITDAMTEAVPKGPRRRPGWHDDPDDAGRWRWWTGSEWSGHVRPRPRAMARIRPAHAWIAFWLLLAAACVSWLAGWFQNWLFFGDIGHDGDAELALASWMGAVTILVGGYAGVLSFIRGSPPEPDAEELQ